VYEALRQVLERSEVEGGETYSRGDIDRWAPRDLERLLEDGILRPCERARSIEYAGCDHRCVVEAAFQSAPATGRIVCIFPCSRGCGNVEFDETAFDQWEFNLLGLAAMVARAVNATGELVAVVPGRLASIGLVGGEAYSREFFVGIGLSRRDAPALINNAKRFLMAREPVVLTAARVPPLGTWPDGMQPVVRTLVENLQVGARGPVLTVDVLLGHAVIPHPSAKASGWITHAQATSQLRAEFHYLKRDSAKGEVSRAVREGAFKTNGETRKKLRIDAVSFCDWLTKRRHSHLAKDDPKPKDTAKDRSRESRGWHGVRG
jgi:hypothetical protein